MRKKLMVDAPGLGLSLSLYRLSSPPPPSFSLSSIFLHVSRPRLGRAKGERKSGVQIKMIERGRPPSARQLERRRGAAMRCGPRISLTLPLSAPLRFFIHVFIFIVSPSLHCFYFSSTSSPSLSQQFISERYPLVRSRLTLLILSPHPLDALITPAAKSAATRHFRRPTPLLWHFVSSASGLVLLVRSDLELPR